MVAVTNNVIAESVVASQQAHDRAVCCDGTADLDTAVVVVVGEALKSAPIVILMMEHMAPIHSVQGCGAVIKGASPEAAVYLKTTS